MQGARSRLAMFKKPHGLLDFWASSSGQAPRILGEVDATRLSRFSVLKRKPETLATRLAGFSVLRRKPEALVTRAAKFTILEASL